MVFAAIKKSHEEAGLVGHHDIYHAARVGDTAFRIALSEWRDRQLACLAGLAGLCHNADRIVQQLDKVGRQDVAPYRVAALVEEWVVPAGLTESDCSKVSSAVLMHGGRNGNDDSRVLIALMDADRVVNLDLDIVIRTGQYQPDIPSVDYTHFVGDPSATYRNPKSVLRELAYCLDWVKPESGVCVRTEAGKKLAEHRAVGLGRFISLLQAELEEEGMLPAPF